MENRQGGRGGAKIMGNINRGKKVKLKKTLTPPPLYNLNISYKDSNFAHFFQIKRE